MYLIKKKKLLLINKINKGVKNRNRNRNSPNGNWSRSPNGNTEEDESCKRIEF
jgi:hypothetical protein